MQYMQQDERVFETEGLSRRIVDARCCPSQLSCHGDGRIPCGLAAKHLTRGLYFDNTRNMKARKDTTDVARLADMMAAMGAEPRLRIMRLLLSAHPDGVVVGDIQEDLGINGSTLSHHLEKLRHEDLVRTTREGTFLRYTVNTESLQTLLTFLYSECCGRSRAVSAEELIKRCAC